MAIVLLSQSPVVLPITGGYSGAFNKSISSQNATRKLSCVPLTLFYPSPDRDELQRLRSALHWVGSIKLAPHAVRRAEESK